MKAELILCQNADDDLQNITNIFSEIRTDDRGNISFTVISKIIYEENDISKNVIHFFILKHIDENKIRGAYMAEIELHRQNKKDDSFKTMFPNIPVEGSGKYSIVLIKNNDMENMDSLDGPKVYDEGEIIGEVFFDVE